MLTHILAGFALKADAFAVSASAAESLSFIGLKILVEHLSIGR